MAREIVKAEELVDYTRRDNVAERLAKKFGAAMGEGAIRALKTVPAIALSPSALAADGEHGRGVVLDTARPAASRP